MTIEERLSELERSSRRWCSLAFGLGAVLAVTVGIACSRGMAGKSEVTDVVRTRKLEILNEEGQSLILLSASQESAGLIIRDASGGPLVALLGANDTGLMSVSNGAGITGATIQTGEGGGGILTIYNGLKNEAVVVQSNKANCGMIVVHDFNGKPKNGLVGQP